MSTSGFGKGSAGVGRRWKWLARFLRLFNMIKPGQKFRNCPVEQGRDLAVEVDVHQQRDQFLRFVHEDAVLGRHGDNLLGH